MFLNLEKGQSRHPRTTWLDDTHLEIEIPGCQDNSVAENGADSRTFIVEYGRGNQAGETVMSVKSGGRA
jgi:hypothetical protein